MSITQKALTHLALENIKISDELYADMLALDAGQLIKEEFINRAIERTKK